ncbi:MAG: TonB-dependent receptor, partial [Rhizobium sp.]
VSYSTSFQPLSGTTDTGSALKPTEGKQYEIGVKYQPVGSDSFVTASLFDLRQTNVKVSSSLYPGSVTQTGEVRSRGVELEAHAYLTDDLQAIASYTYTDVENTRATANIEGKRPAGIPANMASLWLSYDMPDNIAPGLKVMGGTRFVGKSYGNPTNTFAVPSVTLFDIGLQYDFEKQFPKAKGLTASLNVSNLFDKTYVTCTDVTYCTYGQGRVVLAGLRYKW